MTPTNEQIIKELNREITMRIAVYPNQILQGKLTKEQSDYRINCLREAIKIIQSTGQQKLF